MTSGWSRWTLAGAGFCVFMLLIHMFAGFNSAGIPDFWRDMYWATRIANGEAYPLAGPPIYQLLELGPWWFYLLAMPVWLTHRIAVASMFIQALAAMKYFLAWRFGTRLVDARFGFAFAVSLAASGWALAPLVFPTHSALIETSLLLLAYATWRFCGNAGLASAVLFGLASSACLHAHPSTALYIVVASMTVLWNGRSARTFGLLTLSATLVLLSLTPPLFDGQLVDDAFRKPLSTYLNQDLGHDIPSRLAKLVGALFVGGTWSGLLLLTRWKFGAIVAAWTLSCFCLALSLSGNLLLVKRNGRLYRHWRFALMLLCIQILFLVVIRPNTPIWMVPTCLIPMAFAMAVGWYGLIASEKPLMRHVGMAALLVYGTIAMVPFHFFLGDVHSLRTMSQANPYWDITQSADDFETVAVPFVPAWELDALGRHMCAPVTLHGLLAKSIDQSLATTVRNACGYWPDVWFAGEKSGRHVAGLSSRIARLTGIEPDQTISNMALFSRLDVIAPKIGHQADQLRRMQVGVKAGGASAQPSELEFQTSAQDVVSITSRASFSPTAIGNVLVSGMPARLLYANGGERLYRCDTCIAGQQANWLMQLDVPIDDVDLIVLKKGSQTSPPR